MSFALYLPHQYSDTDKLPVMILFDPHGDGSFPIYKYKSFAEKFGVIMMGSNDSKNGINFDQTNSIVQALVDEALQRFHADQNQISLAGFSGGAKVVLMASSQMTSILSIVYCSAGLPQLPQQLPPALGITGLKDMNYTEVVETDQQLESNHIEHSLIEWNGKHEWCDTSTFENAFYWIEFRAMEKKVVVLDGNLVQGFVKQNSKTISNPLAEEMRLKKLISFLNGVADVSKYQTALESLRKEKSFAAGQEKQKSDLELESRMKQNYFECIEQKDVTWWHDEATHMRVSKSNAMNDRILGYISLACYSLSNSALKRGDYQKAEKYLAIYSFVDPENIDRAFMQAIWYAHAGNKVGALQLLRDAISYGFTDKSKLMTDESFASIRNSNEFNEVLNKLK